MRKILIIDDNPDMVLALRMPLEASGYEVSEASTGAEGLRAVREAPPDLIILDAAMETGTPGFQVSLLLRNPDPASEYAPYRRIPILMLTAMRTTISLQFGPEEASLPVDDCIEKPVDADLLLEKVQALTG